MDDLSTLLHDAVADVEPTDRLAEIRERTASEPQRGRWYAAGGALLAVAAALTAFAVLGDPRPSDDGIDPGDTPSASEQSLYPVYYLGDTPLGTRLYREFQQQYGAGGSLAVAAQLVSSPPDDPDYRTPWDAGAFFGAKVTNLDGRPVIRVDVGDVTPDRPQGVSRADAELAIQQVVYTMQAVAQDDTLPVQFYFGQGPADTLIGVDVSQPLDSAQQLDVLSRVNISDPFEGQTVEEGSTLEVLGRANSFEANVVWRLQRYEGTEIVGQGNFTAEGYMEEKLFPFEGEIDLAGIPAGRYLLMVSTDDPSGEGRFYSDTRTVVVE